LYVYEHAFAEPKACHPAPFRRVDYFNYL
jgi:hypothetical protein